MSPKVHRWFDSHCHINAPQFSLDRAAVMQRARDNGVETLFVPGVTADFASAYAPVESLSPAPVRIFAGVGLHPYFLDSFAVDERDAFLERLPALAALERYVAIGECGLDKPLARRQKVNLNRQIETFDAHLAAARTTNKPVVLHVVGAHGTALQRLRQTPPARGGIVHWFSGSAEQVSEYAELGFYFGFGAAILSGSEKGHRALRRTPLDRLVLETDAPDQSLQTRGIAPERNEPSLLPRIAAEIALLLELPVSELAHLSHHNAQRVLLPARSPSE